MITSDQALKIISDFCEQHNVSLFGTCSIDELKDGFYLSPEELKGITHAISLAMPLSAAVLNGIIDQPTLLYKWHYRQANSQLDKLAFLLAIKIQDLGYLALPIAASQVIDWQKQIGHVSHRHVAVKAGLGWLGRNNLLVTQKYGAHLRLVTILTNLPLPEGVEQEFQCGECIACVQACPVNAIGSQASEHKFEKCFELLDFFCKKKNMNLHICGVCVKACKGNLT